MSTPTMLYPEIFKTLEKARWRLETDVPWAEHQPELLSDEQARTIKMNAITEWSALPATDMFLRDFCDDADFCAFMSVWFYEEQKHSLVLQEYLRRFRPEYAPTEQELQAVRFEFDPAPPLETLMMHFCGEMRLTQWYRRAAEWHTEPVIKHIYTLISQDEARHGGCYRKYMERAIQKQGNVARMAFARMGVLMASIRTSNALHPTNLHVNKKLFPHDTVQSRLPEPGWVERWLNNQIDFNLDWQKRVIQRILASLSGLLHAKLESVRDLQIYRKTLTAQAVK